MKVLVTGANGFLGRSVVSALLERGHAVRAVVRPAASLDGIVWKSDVEIVRADLRTHDGLAEFFDQIDVLIHLAATVIGDDDAHINNTMVGTERLLQAMATTPVNRLILAGTVFVYGWLQAKGSLDEETVIDPDIYSRGGYAVAKLWQERVVRRFSEENQWDFTVMRPGMIWGVGHESVPGVMFRLGSIRFVLGIARQVPLTYVENCAYSFVLAAERPECSRGQTFNVIDGEVVTAWRYAGVYLSRSGVGGVRVPLPFAFLAVVAWCAELTRKLLFGKKGRLPSMLKPSHVAFFKPLRFSDKKLRRQLDWQPPYSFRQACDRCFHGSQ